MAAIAKHYLASLKSLISQKFIWTISNCSRNYITMVGCGSVTLECSTFRKQLIPEGLNVLSKHHLAKWPLSMHMNRSTAGFTYAWTSSPEFMCQCPALLSGHTQWTLGGLEPEIQVLDTSKKQGTKTQGISLQICVQKLVVKQKQDKLPALNIRRHCSLNGQVGLLTFLWICCMAQGSVPHFNSAATLCCHQSKNKLQTGWRDMWKVGQPPKRLIVWQPSHLLANISLQARGCDFILSEPDLTPLQSKQSKYSLFDWSI